MKLSGHKRKAMEDTLSPTGRLMIPHGLAMDALGVRLRIERRSGGSGTAAIMPPEDMV